MSLCVLAIWTMSTLLLTFLRRGYSLSHSSLAIRKFGFTIRFAKQTDVEFLDACNRATLPENYQPDFYQQHISRWPELSLIALTEDNEMVIFFISSKDFSQN